MSNSALTSAPRAALSARGLKPRSSKTPEKLQSCTDGEVAPSRKSTTPEKGPPRRNLIAECGPHRSMLLHGSFQETDGVATCTGTRADFQTTDCKVAGRRAQSIGQSVETRRVER